VENIQAGLDKRFKATGHKNALFPAVRAREFSQARSQARRRIRTKKLLRDQRPVARILQERLAIRPTAKRSSATSIPSGSSPGVTAFADHQWANIVRWEKRNGLFLCARPSFFGQEGHTAHGTAEEAQEETMRNARRVMPNSPKLSWPPVPAWRKDRCGTLPRCGGDVQRSRH